MSGDEGPRQPAQPVDLTDDEVEQLAGPRRSRVAAITRLKALVPSGPIGRLETRSTVPASVSATELAAVQKQGRLPDRVAKKLVDSEPAADAPAGPDGPPIEGPVEVPRSR